MSLVEYVYLHIDEDTLEDYPESLRSLWLATATSNLKGVSLSACVTNLGDLIHVFIDEVFNKPADIKHLLISWKEILTHQLINVMMKIPPTTDSLA